MASATRPDPSAEAVCGLSALHTAEQAFFGEKDRHDIPAVVGFLPLPCTDGTRPAAPDSHSVGGCQFVFTVLEAGRAPDTTLKLEARGVTLATRNLRFLLDGRDGFITRADSNAHVAPVDCEAWRRAADPLLRYHELVGEYDCVTGPYAPTHPCTEALTQLVNLASQGVGVARKEYDAHPTARELYPLSPPTPAMLLCGVTASAQQRAQHADLLSSQGRLLDAVLQPGCRDAGLRVGIPLLFRDGACPGPRCLELMTLAQRLGLPERFSVLEDRASLLVQWLWDQPTTFQRDFLRTTTERGSDRIDALMLLRKGTRPSVLALTAPPLTSLEMEWLERAHREHPALSPIVELLREQQRGRPASEAAFQDWARTVPCAQLHDAHDLAPTPARLRVIAQAQSRCPQDAIAVLSRHVATLSPAQVIDVLGPLTVEPLRLLRVNLGLGSPERAEALFDWVMARDPSLLEGLATTPAIAAKLLTPAYAERMGGREAVLDLLLDPQRSPHVAPTYDALVFVMAEALKGTPSAARVRNVAERNLRPEDRQRLLSGILRAGDPRLQAAAAAGAADWNDASGISPSAARACLAEVRVTLECMATQSRPLGPPPPGTRQFFFGCGMGPQPPPAPIEAWCTRFDERVASCPTTCGGALPGPSELALLASIAGEPPPTAPEGLRACTPAHP
ncbi:MULTISPECIES: hypothetical protein [unclassified Corallococcus]|uniref:hypothetical protein n=1 Tax=unclassified Corallococcus TaxID=2685029 RepID=UPI001A8EDD34|nr:MULTISPECIES: hypothetical protein [unclassified Corallococcus]MBN9687677.1 hypothetical protein [Corallococcus sp. NCSPR001]WAS88507.1 hypothetical protein O0N60_16340 [Corallococcus sp. NCRR]